MSDKVIVFNPTAIAKFNYADAQKQLAQQNDALQKMGDTSIITVTIYNGYINIHVRVGNPLAESDKKIIEKLRAKLMEEIREQELNKVTQILDI